MKNFHYPFIRLAFIIAVLFASVTAHAYDCIYDGIYYNLDTEERTAAVTYYDFNSSINGTYYKNAINIPGKIFHNGTEYTVTAIDEYAFDGCKQLTSVTLPNHLTSIGELAFSDCEALANIKFPDALTVIGDHAFDGCHTFTAVDLSACKLTTIDNGAFGYCKELNEVTIGKSITAIPPMAFNDCSKLTTVHLPDGITSIGKYAFCECVELQNFTLPSALTTIDTYAFYKCYKLASITIPETVTSIGTLAFGKCTGLQTVNFNAENCETMGTQSQHAFMGCDSLSTLHIGDKVRAIPDNAFFECAQISNALSLPESLTSIGKAAFYSCNKLPSVTIPKAVTFIGPRAFAMCRGLTSVTFNAGNCTTMGSDSMSVFDANWDLSTFYIGKNVTSLPAYIFRHCPSVKHIYCPAPTPPTCPDDFKSDIYQLGCKLYVLKESASLYKAANFWKHFIFRDYNGTGGIDGSLVADDAPTLYDVYTMQGVKVGNSMREADLPATLPRGIYILVAPGHTCKVSI